MAVAKKKQQLLQGDPAYLEVRGSLIGSEYIPNIVRLQTKYQDPRTYGVAGALVETIAKDYATAQTAWEALARGRRTPAAVKTFLTSFLTQSLGFTSLAQAQPVVLDEMNYPITHTALNGRVPIVMTATALMDERSEELKVGKKNGAGFAVLQEYLNAQEGVLWGIACDRDTLRLARDNASLSRYAYINADFKPLFEGPDGFGRFVSLWLLCHQSRFGAPNEAPERCALELWRDAAREQGTRARDQMRHQVQNALNILGCGFLENSDNDALRDALRTGTMTPEGYYGKLLRVVYRVMALAVLEERGVVPAASGTESARQAYWQEYSLRDLRKKAVVPSHRSRSLDMWEVHKLVCKKLDTGNDKQAMPRLGGPFASARCAELDACSLSNERLLDALYQLCYTHDDQALTPVNWRDMGMEELGSIYESLLELQPQLLDAGRTFHLESEGAGKGSKRKSTGSYYTPDALVQALLDSGLDPLLKIARAAGDREAQLNATLALRVLDPACGSAHILIAAARRIAHQVADLDSDGAATPATFQRAMRRVLSHCIFGVDKNPMVLDIIETGFWMDSVVDGSPTGFFSHHIRCGDSLAGLLELHVLVDGIPDGAYKPLVGDSKEVCREALRKNREARKRPTIAANLLEQALENLSQSFAKLDALDDATAEAVQRKDESWTAYVSALENSTLYRAAQLYSAAYLCPKSEDDGEAIPTTQDLHDAFAGKEMRPELTRCLQTVTEAARPLHWSLVFPQVMAHGGFDLVIMNPPWERITLNEQEFFGARSPAVAQAKNKAARGTEIERLAKARKGSAERATYDAFVVAKHAALGLSNYAHDVERFARSGRGDVNTYALFTETALQLKQDKGRAAMIVPSGIASDSGTQELFGYLSQNKLITSMYDFENRKGIFPIDSRLKFCLLTLGRSRAMSSAFYLTDVADMEDSERLLDLTPDDLNLFNPNTKTSPTFRSRRDLEIARKVYKRVPALWNENVKDGNPWDIKFCTMFHMSNDSGLFVNSDGKSKMRGMLPLYEAKMFHQFDHRWATYESSDGSEITRDITKDEKLSAEFSVSPRYFVRSSDLERLRPKEAQVWPTLAYRKIGRCTDLRTMIASLLHVCTVGDSALVVGATNTILLTALFNSIVFDYLLRQKTSGINLGFYIIKQVPLMPPSYFNAMAISRIERIVKGLQWPLFADPANPGQPWPADARASIRAELDAYFAAAYGLDRRDLAFILDPQNEANAHTPHPSETFSVLKRDEMKAFGEYRTERLILEAWDRMEERGELPDPYTP